MSIVSASFRDHSCHGLSFFCALLEEIMTVASKSMLKDSFFMCLGPSRILNVRGDTRLRESTRRNHRAFVSSRMQRYCELENLAGFGSALFGILNVGAGSHTIF